MFMQCHGIFMVLFLLFKKASKNVKDKQKWMRIVRLTSLAGMIGMISILVFVQVKLMELHNEEDTCEEEGIDKSDCIADIGVTAE